MHLLGIWVNADRLAWLLLAVMFGAGFGASWLLIRLAGRDQPGPKVGRITEQSWREFVDGHK
jgi:hypothetical protein